MHDIMFGETDMYDVICVNLVNSFYCLQLMIVDSYESNYHWSSVFLVD